MREIDNCCLKTGSEYPSAWCARKCRLYKEAYRRADQFYPRPRLERDLVIVIGVPTYSEIRAEAKKILAAPYKVVDELKEAGFTLGRADHNLTKPEDRNVI